MTSVVDVPSNSRENGGGGYDDFQFDFRAFEIRDPDGAEGPKARSSTPSRTTCSSKSTSPPAAESSCRRAPTSAHRRRPHQRRGLRRPLDPAPYRNVYWTVGALGGSSAVTVDPTTGYRATWPCWHPSLGGPLTACGGTGMALIPGYLNFGGFVIDPEGEHNL